MKLRIQIQLQYEVNHSWSVCVIEWRLIEMKLIYKW